MTIKRFIKKGWFRLRKALLFPLVFINHRLYMRLYVVILKSTGIKISGTPRFIAYSVKIDDFELISFGDRLVISSNVILLTHDYSYTTSLISIGRAPITDVGILGPINIGNNVFIGMNSIILPGTRIGNNVIIGAGSVVRGTIEDYSVVTGNPAKVIGDIREHAEKISKKNYVLRIDNF